MDKLLQPLLQRGVGCSRRQALGKEGSGARLVTNETIVHLGVAGRQKLLELANMSWARGELPSIWRKGIIVSILKKGKPRELSGLYHPVNLLSCLGKVVRRLVQARLY